jgi:chemotaxis protein MotB
MSSEAPDIIFIRRSLRRRQEAPHGGVWKIAFADFMTAMMAFFLVMWLISATDQKTRETVASYFNPVKLAAATVDKKGLRDPQEVDKDRTPEATGRQTSEKTGDQSGSGDTRISDHRQASHERKPRFSEAALFEDPYAVLAALVAGSEPGQAADKVGAFETRGQSGEPGLNGGEAQRDPFDPVYWKMARAPQTQARDGKENGGAKTASAGTTAAEPAPPPPAPAATEATPQKPTPAPKETSDKPVSAETAERTETPPPAAEAGPAPAAASDAAAEPRPSDQKRDATKTAPATPPAQTAQTTQTGQAETRELGRRIEAAVKQILPAPGVQVAETSEGMLVTLMDDADFGMFAIGSAEPQPELIRAVDAIGKVIAGQKGSIVLRGHTDGRPFRSRDYDNWRLSTARAHMAYFMLVRGGVAKERFERIEGYADQQLKRRDDPGAPQNRRIEILIRRPAP